MNKYQIIGSRQNRVDALGKVTGAAKYAADYNLPFQLFGAVKYAEYPHAIINTIDTTKADKLPGVVAVLTYRDIPGKNHFGLIPNIRILADDKTRYLGDIVAIVAAENTKIANEAVKMIEVEYEKLSAVFDPEEALKPDAVKLYNKGNRIVHHKVRKGNVAEGFRQADFIIENKYTTPAVEHAYLEPEAALAMPDEHDGFKIIGCMQNLYTSHKVIAAALDKPLSKVQIIQSTMGGSFGGKDESATLVAVRAALLAQKTNRPVKIVNSREDSFRQSYKRHPYKLFYKWACKKDGTISAMEIKIIADGGAYCSMSPFVTWRSVVQATGPYYCPNVQTDVFAAYTNNNFTGAMRGFGSPQVNFAIESMMDELAERTEKSPLEIRLLNGFGHDAITATGQKLDHYVSLKDVLKTSAEETNFEKRWEENKSNQQVGDDIVKGIGLACAYRGVSLGAEGVDAPSSIVYVQPDGSVSLSSGIIDMGQGAKTAMSQIAAEVLGLPLSQINFQEPDSGRVADSGATVASRGTIMGGGAMKIAAENVRKIMEETAREKFNLQKEDFIFKDENIFIRQNKNIKQLCSFNFLVNACYQSGRPLFASGVRKIDVTSWDEKSGRGNAYFTFVYGANIAEVEVDLTSGKVNVTRFLSTHDVGKAVNQSMVEGQIYGGVAMGIGYGIMEEFIQESGIARTLNFDEYYIPTALDMPPMKTIIIENEDKFGPFGAKSIGEPALEIAAPAIINAIYNATGKRIYHLPANLEEVLLGQRLHRDIERGSVSCKIES